MSTCNSTPKPAKPYPEFPLFPHANGYWAKKIRGKLHYFGKWEDGWQAALDTYDTRKAALHAGKRPRAEAGELILKDLCNDFLDAKEAKLCSGELSIRTLKDYEGTCHMVVKFFGGQRLVVDLGTDDFGELRVWMAKRWGLVRLGNIIQRVSTLFKYAYDTEKIDKPVRMGPEFKRPSSKTMRVYRSKQGAKMFTAAEIHKLLDAAEYPLRTMILLGINCGFGNSDCANLPTSAVDLVGGWIDFPRPKTGVARRCPLWPETVRAIHAAMVGRPAPKDTNSAGLVFITKYGNVWGKDDNAHTPIGKEFAKLLKRLDITGRRSFYALRHTHRTIADAAKDQPAADMVMGHLPQHISNAYRETIDDVRLQAVSDHVRGWLFGK
jgi:integrase